MNSFEQSIEYSLDICDLGIILEKTLPVLKIYAKEKDVVINSTIIPPVGVSGNDFQLRTVFKQLLYLLIKEFEMGGKLELFSQNECHQVVITINAYGLMKFEIAYEAICSIEEIFSQKFAWRTQATKLFFIYNTLKQNRSKMSIYKLSPVHRIISIILPANNPENIQ
ncbi:MAG: hypothetical protein NTX65_13010 [Ignavibacteriales bacterium]|nr:hypothetical protein [Ignavibacteriales bacterium]